MAIAADEIHKLLAEAGVEEAALRLHERLAGKISTAPKAELTEDTLELLYTPGVGAVSRRLADDAGRAQELTWRGNALAVVSDGSAILGLGNLGPEAAMPVRSFPPELFDPAPDVVVHMIPMGEADARAAVDGFAGRAERMVWLSSGDVYRAYGRFTGIEPGPPEPVPLTEDAPLRTVLYPYRGQARSADVQLRA